MSVVELSKVSFPCKLRSSRNFTVLPLAVFVAVMEVDSLLLEACHGVFVHLKLRKIEIFSCFGLFSFVFPGISPSRFENVLEPLSIPLVRLFLLQKSAKFKWGSGSLFTLCETFSLLIGRERIFVAQQNSKQMAGNSNFGMLNSGFWLF